MASDSEPGRRSRCEYFTQTGAPLCSAFDPFQDVDLHYAQRICMGGFWDVCPRYRLAQQNARLIRAPSPAPKRPGEVGGMRMGRARARVGVAFQWGALMIFVVALGMFGGMLLRYRGLSFLASPPEPYSVTAVVPPTSSPTMTPSPSPPSTPSASPAPTSTSTQAPSDTPTATASSSGTASPTATSTATGTGTPTRPPTPVPSPLPTSTPFPPPALIAPADGQHFSHNADVLLEWSSVGTLPEDAYYVVTLAYPHGNQTWYDETPWLKETSWQADEHAYLPELSNDGNFTWSVRVMLLTGEDERGRPSGVPLGVPSAQRAFYWARRPGSASEPTPQPPAP